MTQSRVGSPANLLPRWGFGPDTQITPAGQGTNNHTFLVRDGQRRYVLRISGFGSAARIRAEHRILRLLRQGALSLQVPEPLAADGGQTMIETGAGLATVCRWLPGGRPPLISRTDYHRLGRVTALLGTALAEVPPGDTATDWRTDPRWIHPGDPPVDDLCGELRAAGLSTRHADTLSAAARRAGRWWPAVSDLPAQVIHGDLAAGNLLADPVTAEITGVLDFELAGTGFRVQDVLFALFSSRALDGPDWAGRTAAFMAGCARVRPLEPAEIAVLPGLLLARALGSALWRAARWRAGAADLSEVQDRAARLEKTMQWLAANETALVSVATAANDPAVMR